MTINNSMLLIVSAAVSLPMVSTQYNPLGWFLCPDFPVNECSINSDCGPMKICNGNKCIGGCSKKKCGINKGCQIIDDNISSCECLPGFYRDLQGQCVPNLTCSDDNQCDPTEQCRKKKCINACFEKKCGPNESCQVNSPHNSSCECSIDFIRNSTGVCVRKICSINEDCESTERCRKGECVSACSERFCDRSNELCQVNHQHSFSCHCEPGLIRNIKEGECGTQ